MNQFKRSALAADFTPTKVRQNTAFTSPLLRPYERTVSVFNGLNDPVTLVDRLGIATTIPPLYSREFSEFIIRVSYSIPKAVNFDSKHILSVSSDRLDLREIKKAIDHRLNSDQYSICEPIQIDYAVSFKDLADHGGSIYINDLDVVISFHHGSDIPYHPFSMDGQKRSLSAQDEQYINKDRFGMSIRIIDNSGRFGDRFVNYNGWAFKVPSIRNPTMKDGVYFASTGIVSGNFEAHASEEFYTFDQADKALGLYRSVEDALTFGDVLGAKEREIEQGKLDRKQMEHQMEKERSLRQHELAEMERLRKLEENYIKLISMGRSDVYEQRSQERKEALEVTKFIPHLVIAVVSIATTLAFKKS